jgi:YfiH family protein
LTGWRKQPIGDLPLYQAKTMAWLPRITQGFTTRHGGVSAAPYDSLNLGVHVGDALAHVQANRQRVWQELKAAEDQVVLAEQVHGNQVAVVSAGSGAAPIAGADALVTDTTNLLLMLFFADCVPVYLVDPVRKVIGLAHAGWRGTAANIAGKTLQAMTAEFGCVPSACFAAVGPSIGTGSYEVGPEVADRFRTLPGARASNVVTPRSEISGTYNLNLRAVIFGQLLHAGVPAGAIAVCDEDTFRNKRDFFSYRRDGVTGRMAAFLSIKGK